MLLENYGVFAPHYPSSDEIPVLAGVGVPSGSVVYFTSTGVYTFGNNLVVGLGPEINLDDNTFKAGENRPFSLDSLAGKDCMLKVEAEEGCGLLSVEVL
jgi:hypothetical protein